ncbi:hypothetical protein HO133_006399 [Letharia lupina]|uniref:Rhodopsin domain-containing protein n=1 Tax=Letharia lupina TaxID=560253 RepID=A0A8H6F7C5_9LECA|nr:uncharacterized protein HO133_006399 [Letharia lupina]KAF6217987.1 hypothetical protein HO133_006399 [Letharia lupina]
MSSPTGSNASAGNVLVAVSWTFFVVSLVVVALRFYADIFIIHLVRIDSYLTFLTFLLVIVSQVFTQISVHYGMGTHIDALTPNAVVLALKYCWVAQPFQLLALAFGKIAAVTYLATIHGPRNANIKLAFLWIVGLVQLLSGIVILGFIYSQCSPMTKLWNVEIPGTCNGRARNVYMAYLDGSLSAFSNLCISLYPTLIFWNLQMKTTKKVVLCLLFGTGVIAAVCAVFKTTKVSTLGKTTDITYDMTGLMTWTAVEQYTVLLAGSIPPLRPAIKELFNKASSTTYYRSRNTNTLRLDDEATLTSSTVSPGKTSAYTVGTKGRSEAFNGKRDSTEKILSEMGEGGIMMTTRIEVENRIYAQRMNASRDQMVARNGREGV